MYQWLKKLLYSECGYASPIGIAVYAILAIVAVVIIFKFLPTLSASNAELQNVENVSSMTKTMAGIGEWLIPTGILLALGLGAFFLISTGVGGGRRRH